MVRATRGTVLALAIVAAATGCQGRGKGRKAGTPAGGRGSSPDAAPARSAARPPPSDLGVLDINVGKGDQAVGGKLIKVNFTGDVIGGRRFDSTYETGEPIEFQLGAGQVIRGWDLGLVGMKVGGKRRLVVPAGFGYGATPGLQAIPPNSTLVFDIELLDVRDPPAAKVAPKAAQARRAASAKASPRRGP